MYNYAAYIRRLLYNKKNTIAEPLKRLNKVHVALKLCHCTSLHTNTPATHGPRIDPEVFCSSVAGPDVEVLGASTQLALKLVAWA